MTAPDSRDSCKHFWSQPDTAGMIQCLWCQKVAPAPGQYVTDNTLARGPQQAGGEDAPPCPVWLAGKDVSHAWAAGWNARNPHYAALQAEVARLTAENATLERNLAAAMDAVHEADKEAETAEAALRLAHSHLDMPALRVSHCKDAAAIDAALNGGQDDNA